MSGRFPESGRRSRFSPRLLILAALLWLLVFAVYVGSPNVTPFDSRWVVHTAHSLLHEGNPDLNEFLPLLEAQDFYFIGCVLPGGRWRVPVRSPDDCSGGRYYHLYPLGNPVLAAPPLWALEQSIRAGQPILGPVAARQNTALRRNLLLGDLIASSVAAELLIASAVTALAVALFFLAACCVCAAPAALGLSLVLAFATPAWSTSSRGLWMHGPSMAIHSAVLLLLLCSERLPRRRAATAGGLVALAFFVRPTNAILAGAVALYVWLRQREAFAWFFIGASAVTLVFVAANWSIYGSPLDPYSLPLRGESFVLAVGAETVTALAGQWLSPSRGLLVYCPFVAFSVAGIWLSLRSPARPPDPFLALLLPAHAAINATFMNWFGGHSYGPRFFTDIMPVLVYFLIPAWRAWRSWKAPVLRGLASGAFAVLLVWGIWVHFRGATARECYEWNVNPGPLEQRLWSWDDPPFLRGLRVAAHTGGARP